MRNLSFTCLALTAMVAFGQTAQTAQAASVPIQLTLTDDAGANLFIAAIGGVVTASIPFDISGTIDVSLDEAISGNLVPDELVNNTTGIALTGADIDLSDESLSLSLGLLGGVDGAIVGAGINTLDSNGNIALTTTNPTNPFEYSFDPGGGNPTSLAIDQGQFTYLGFGPLGGALGSGTIDFSSEPVEAELPSLGQIGLVTQDVVAQIGNTVTVDVVVSAPLTFSDTILTDPIDVTVDLSGALVATGFYTYIVPEPSTLVLLGIAFVGLIPMWRRLRK